MRSRFWASIFVLLAAVMAMGGCAQDERVTKLAEELRRMRSDTETGLNMEAYADRLRDINFALKEVVDNGLGTDMFRLETKYAVDAYKKAGTAWALKLDFGDQVFTFREIEYSEGKKFWVAEDADMAENSNEILEAHLLIHTSDFKETDKVTLEDVIQAYWRKAGEHSDKALRELD